MRLTHRVSSSQRFALYHPPHPSALAKELGTPHLVDGMIGVLHDVELAVYDPAVRNPLLQAQPEGLPHVHTGRLDTAPLAGAHEFDGSVWPHQSLQFAPFPARISFLPPRREWSLATPVGRRRLGVTDAGVAKNRAARRPGLSASSSLLLSAGVERFCSGLDDVCPVRDPVQQRLTEPRIWKHGHPFRKP